MQQSFEDVLEEQNNNNFTQKENYLQAIKGLKDIYLKELKKINKNRQNRQLSQNELYELANNIFNHNDILLEQKSQQKDLKNQVILSVSFTQKQNQLVKTSQGIYYVCKCHNAEFQTNQELGGHQRKLK